MLIADDDPTSRTVLTLNLESRGHEVVSTDNGTEAWQALQRPEAPQMAVLDWMMPGLSGVEVVSLVREHATRPVYLIMLTARDQSPDVVTALEAGADDYVTKPFDAYELLARVAVGERMLETQTALANRVTELRDALDHVETLRGILPICAKCKRVRDDEGYWNQVEVYFQEHAQCKFSHGLCPSCAIALYPDMDLGADSSTVKS